LANAPGSISISWCLGARHSYNHLSVESRGGLAGQESTAGPLSAGSARTLPTPDLIGFVGRMTGFTIASF